jgi:hypothetical protein
MLLSAARPARDAWCALCRGLYDFVRGLQGYGVTVVGIERVKNLPMWQARPNDAARIHSGYDLMVNQTGIGRSGWLSGWLGWLGGSPTR